MLQPLSLIDLVALLPFCVELLFQYMCVLYTLAYSLVRMTPRRRVLADGVCVCVCIYLFIFPRLLPSFRGALTLRTLRLLRLISFVRLERSYCALKNLRMIFTSKKVPHL